MTEITTKSSKDEIITSAMELTDRLIDENYNLRQERQVLWICVGILLSAQFLLH